MKLRNIIERTLLRRESITEDDRAYLLDWFMRAENSAPTSNPVTGQITSIPGPTQDEIGIMVEEALKSRQWIRNLSEISNQTGLQIAGEFRVGNGVEPGDGFTGGRYGWPGFDYGGTDYFLAGVSNDVLQVGLSLTDGKVYAGNGAVVLDEDGIVATQGTIGGWVIGADSLTDAAGVVGISSAVTVGDDIRFWAGNSTPADAPFKVTEAGVLTATNATISGDITAQSGNIGGWVVNFESLYNLTAGIGIVLDSGIPSIKIGDINNDHMILDGANQRIRSSNFSAGAAGMNIDTTTGDAEFNNITARGELKTFLFSANNQMAVGGNILISKDAGKLGADVAAADTTVDFGKAMTVGDWIKIQGPDSAGSNALEWMLVGSNVSGTTYNVTRNVDGSGANDWDKDTPFVVIGQDGDSRIELVAGASGSIQLITQGAAWNTQTVQASMSTVDGAIVAGANAIKINATGILFDNDAGVLYFKDTLGSAANGTQLYGANNDDFLIVNRKPGKAIAAAIYTTDDSTYRFRWSEDPSNANVTQADFSLGAAGGKISMGTEVVVWAGKDGTATVFNEGSFDIDFRIESATNANAFLLDAGAETISFFTDLLIIDGGTDRRLEIGTDHYFPTRNSSNPNGFWNEANQDMDFTFEGTSSDVLKIDAGLNAAILNGINISQATSYTPSLTNISLGNGTMTGSYTQIGKLVKGEVEIVFGNSTSVSGSVQVTKPVNSALTNSFPVGLVRMVAGGNAFLGVALSNSASNMIIAVNNASGTYLKNSALSSTVPGTWTTGDRIQIQFEYFAA